MYEAEVNISNYLKMRINHDDENIDVSRVDQLLQDFEKNQGITYAKKQKEALFYF